MFENNNGSPDQVEDRLHREDELGNRVWRHQVSDNQSNHHGNIKTPSSSSGVAGRAGGCDSFSAVGPPPHGEDVEQEPHLCQQVQEKPREIVEQVVF